MERQGDEIIFDEYEQIITGATAERVGLQAAAILLVGLNARMAALQQAHDERRWRSAYQQQPVPRQEINCNAAAWSGMWLVANSLRLHIGDDRLVERALFEYDDWLSGDKTDESDGPIA